MLRIIERIIEKQPVMKGWSADRKYCGYLEDGTRVFLRISPVEKRNMIREMFAGQRAAADLGVPLCQPLELLECEDGIYTVYSWIDGREANEVLPSLSREEQNRYGMESGRILRLIHTIPAPGDQVEWGNRFRAKMSRKIQAYRTCGIRFKGDDAVIEFLESSASLLDGRPQCFHHGDYHTGNMIITETGELVIIDFDRFDYGDPWEEFNRIVFCARISPKFAAGMVDGYFDRCVPESFWRLLAVYIGTNTLSSIPWALSFGNDEIENMLNHANDVMRWYDGMRSPVPLWYV